MVTQQCPCGFYTDPNKECTCNTAQIQKYMARISGPLLDRIDIHIEVPAVNYKDLSSNDKGESSDKIRARVIEAREIQQERFKEIKHIHNNSDMETKEVRIYCELNKECSHLCLISEMSFCGLGYMPYYKTIKGYLS